MCRKKENSGRLLPIIIIVFQKQFWAFCHKRVSIAFRLDRQGFLMKENHVRWIFLLETVVLGAGMSVRERV